MLRWCLATAYFRMLRHKRWCKSSVSGECHSKRETCFLGVKGQFVVILVVGILQLQYVAILKITQKKQKVNFKLDF